MKIVRVDRDYTYRASHRIHIHYREGIEYQRVPEAHAKAIVAAGAGYIVSRQVEE